MYFLFIKIADINYKEDIILALQSVGISKVSCINGKNLEKALSDDFSLFRGFLKSADENEGELIIMTALAESKDQIKEIITNLEEAGIEIKKKEIVRFLALPIALAFDNELGLIDFKDI